MFKIIGWILLIFAVVVFFFGRSGDNEVKTYEKSANEIRYEKTTSDQKACIKTLGQGVYKDKSLSWKMDSCNVPK